MHLTIQIFLIGDSLPHGDSGTQAPFIGWPLPPRVSMSSVCRRRMAKEKVEKAF